jgi:hypothetical protein
VVVPPAAGLSPAGVVLDWPLDEPPPLVLAEPLLPFELVPPLLFELLESLPRLLKLSTLTSGAATESGASERSEAPE